MLSSNPQPWSSTVSSNPHEGASNGKNIGTYYQVTDVRRSKFPKNTIITFLLGSKIKLATHSGI